MGFTSTLSAIVSYINCEDLKQMQKELQEHKDRLDASDERHDNAEAKLNIHDERHDNAEAKFTNVYTKFNDDTYDKNLSDGTSYANFANSTIFGHN